MRFRLLPLVILALGALAIPTSTLRAAAPTLSSGAALDRQEPYKNAQLVSDIYASKGIYGKLQGDLPFDLYKFTADHTGTQTVSLLLPNNQSKDAQLAAVLVDPTTATKPEQLGLPTPNSDYHLSLIPASPTTPVVSENILLQKYRLVSQSQVQLQQGKTYYLWVIDPARQANRYVVKLGSGNAWTGGDFFRSFGQWLRIETDSYAGSSPLHLASSFAGTLILLLGLSVLLGTFLLQQLFALLSNRQKAAGYLLVKLQPYSRIAIWLSLWLLAIGGFLLFAQTGIIGLPFLLIICFILLVVLFLYETSHLSPQLQGVEVSRQESALPLTLRKAWFFTGFLEAITLIASLVFISMLLGNLFK